MGGPPLGLLFGDLFRISTFGSILVAIWLTFGTLGAPFWSRLAPFGSILVAFGATLAPFWVLLVAFDRFRHPFRPILVAFGRFWYPFGSLWTLLGPIMHEKSDFGYPSSQIPANCRLHWRLEQFFSCTLTFLGPGRKYCRRQLRSAPGRRHPGRAEVRSGCVLFSDALYLWIST